MNWVWRAGGAVCIGGCIGAVSACAAATPAPEAKPAPTEPARPSLAVPAVELSPVSAPTDLIAKGRFQGLPATVDTLAEWIELPIDWRRELKHIAPGLLETLDERAAVEFAATLDPESGQEPRVLFAVSLPLSSREAGLALAERRGWPVERVDATRDLVDAGKPCFIAPSLGPSPVRWVCSNERDGLDALEPYLTRGLPTEALPDKAFYASISIDPLRQRYGEKASLLKSLGVPFLLREFSLDRPTFDGALADIASALADELVGLFRTDLKGLVLEADADREKAEFALSAHVELRAGNTWSSKALKDAAGRKELPPDLLWQLPMELQGSFVASRNPELTAGMFHDVSRLLEGLLEYAEVTPAVGRSFAAATRQLNDIQGPITVASKVASDGRPWAKEIGFDYLIAGVDGDRAGALSSWLLQVAKVANDKPLRRSLEKRDLVPGVLPQVSQQAIKVDELTGQLIQIKWSAAESVKLASAIGSDEAAGPLSLFLFTVREGERSWLVMGTDLPEMREALTRLRRTPAAAKPGLEVLRAQPSNGAGWSTLRSVMPTLMRDWVGGNKGRSASRSPPSNVFDSLPERGSTPMTYLSIADAEQQRFSVFIHVPRHALRDAATLLMADLISN